MRRFAVIAVALLLAGCNARDQVPGHPTYRYTRAEWSWDGTAPGTASTVLTGPEFVLDGGAWEVAYTYDCTWTYGQGTRIQAAVQDSQRMSTGAWALPVSGTFSGKGSGYKSYGDGAGRWQLVGHTSCRVTFTVRQ